MKVGDPAWGERQIIEATPAEDALMPRCSHSTRSNGDNATLFNVQRVIPQIVARCKKQTERLAAYLYDRDLYTYCRNIWTYLFNHIQYRYDADGIEQFRTPARAWADRHEGIDCDCFSIFVSCLLANAGVPHGLRITMYGDHDDWQHIYVIVPRNGRTLDEDDPRTYIVIDCVVHQFDVEKNYKTQNTTFMNGLGIPTQTLQGLGSPMTRLIDGSASGLGKMSQFINHSVEGCLGDMDDNTDPADKQMSWDELKLQIQAEREFAAKWPNTFSSLNVSKTTPEQFVAMADYALENWDDEESRRRALAILGVNESAIDGEISQSQADAKISEIANGTQSVEPIDEALEGLGDLNGISRSTWKVQADMVIERKIPSAYSEQELDDKAGQNENNDTVTGLGAGVTVVSSGTPTFNTNDAKHWHDTDHLQPKPTACGDFYVKIKNENDVETYAWIWHKDHDGKHIIEIWDKPTDSNSSIAKNKREVSFSERWGNTKINVAFPQATSWEGAWASGTNAYTKQDAAKRIIECDKNGKWSKNNNDSKWDNALYLDFYDPSHSHYLAIMPDGRWCEVLDGAYSWFDYNGNPINENTVDEKWRKQTGKVDIAAEKAELKRYRQKQLEEAGGFWKRLGLRFKFLFQDLKKYSLTLMLIRGGFLFFTRLNFFGLAKKLHPAATPTPNKFGYTQAQIAKSQKGYEKAIKVWSAIGGSTVARFRNTINNAYDKRAEGKTPIDGLGQLGTGAETVAYVISAMTPFVTACAAVVKAMRNSGSNGLGNEGEMMAAEIYCAGAKMDRVLGRNIYVSGLGDGEEFTDQDMNKMENDLASGNGDNTIESQTDTPEKKQNWFQKIIQWFVNLFKKKDKTSGQEMENLNKNYKYVLTDGEKTYTYDPNTHEVVEKSMTNSGSNNVPANYNNGGGSQVDYTNYNNYNTNDMNNQQEESFFKKHKKALIIGGVVLAAVAVGTGIYISRKKKEEAAETPALTGLRRKRRKSAKTKAVKTLKAY